MLIYIATYAIISAIFAFLPQQDSKKSDASKILCIVSCLLLIVVIGLRHPSMGVDLMYGESHGYLGSFDKLAQKSWGEVFTIDKFMNYEWGYIVFNKLVSTIWNNQQFFLFICACFSIIPFFIVIYKQSDSAFLSTIILAGLPGFLMIFSGLRQAIAMGLCFLAIYFIQEKKPVKFIITVLISCLFHSSSWIFLFAYPMYNVKISKTGRFWSLGILALIFILRGPLFIIFSNLFKEEANISTSDGGFTLLIFFIAIYILCFALQNEKNDEQNGLLNLFFFACCCQCFASVYDTAMRVGFYFMVALILLLPNIVNKGRFQDKEKTVAYVFIAVIFVAFGIFNILTTPWAEAYPYYFFWERM